MLPPSLPLPNPNVSIAPKPPTDPGHALKQKQPSSSVIATATSSGRLKLQVSRFASASTDPMAAELPSAALNTSALSAVRRTILANPALRNRYFPVVTPLKWERWLHMLGEADGLDEFGE